jgi:hypothetical protein
VGRIFNQRDELRPRVVTAGFELERMARFVTADRKAHFRQKARVKSVCRFEVTHAQVQVIEPSASHTQTKPPLGLSATALRVRKRDRPGAARRALWPSYQARMSPGRTVKVLLQSLDADLLEHHPNGVWRLNFVEAQQWGATREGNG